MLRFFFLALFFILPLLGSPLPEVTNVEIKDDAITLKISKPLLSTPKKAALNMPDKSKLKFYFNIGATLRGAFKSGSTLSMPEIKVAQFDKQTVRIVVVADKNAKFNILEGRDFVSIALIGGKKSTEQIADKIIKQINKQPSNISLEDESSAIKKESNEDDNTFITAKKKIIVIDPGHGGKDTGAISDSGIREKDIVLRVAQLLTDMLTKKGYTVYLTRSDDTFIELRDRTSFANKKNADVFVSIHANAVDLRHSDPTKFHGIETYFLSPARSERAKKAAEKENGVDLLDPFSKETFLNFLNREKIVASNKLAIDIQRGMLGYAKSKYKDTTDGGVREAPFWVLVGAQMPAVLVELGYLTHKDELEKLQTDYYKALLAKGIMEGIENYFQNN